MIEIKNLTKKYGDLTVYDNFNLDIEEGKIIAVLGESGSGKTTLLNCLAKLTEFEGSIPNLTSSYVFQTPRLVPNLTVRENLELICADEAKIDEMLEKVELKDKENSFPLHLSGGQAQRVSLARAFLFNSDILLMDEPLSSLDIRLKKQIIELFFKIWRQDGRTAVYVTHDIDEALCLSHRIVVLSGGKIIFDTTPQIPPIRSINESAPLREQLISHLL